MTAHADYWWFKDHPALEFAGHQHPWIEMMPMIVNPETNAIDDDHSLNTKVEWWIEAGPYCDDEHGCGAMHDLDLDCGGDTIDQALAELKRLTLAKYGDYTRADDLLDTNQPIS